MVTYSETNRPESIANQIHEAVSNGVSLVACDEATGEIIGLRAGIVVDRAEALEAKRETMEDLKKTFPVPHSVMMFMLNKYW